MAVASAGRSRCCRDRSVYDVGKFHDGAGAAQVMN
jgi:hypothetical protein